MRQGRTEGFMSVHLRVEDGDLRIIGGVGGIERPSLH